MAYKSTNITKIDENVTNIQTVIGDINNITNMGDGSLVGAIKNIEVSAKGGTKITREEYDALENKDGVYYITDESDSTNTLIDNIGTVIGDIDTLKTNIGTTDISNISDGTVTGVINTLSSVASKADTVVYGTDNTTTEDTSAQIDADLLHGHDYTYFGTAIDIRYAVALVDKLASEVRRLEKMVKGSRRGIVFDTFADMETWLKTKVNPNLEEPVAVGTILYIKATGTSNYWVTKVLDTADVSTNYYYEIEVLDDQEINLTTYDNKIGNADISSLGDGSITSAIVALNNKIDALQSQN